MEQKKSYIIETIENMTESELIDLNNTFCQSANWSDAEIFTNDEDTLQMFFGNDILRAIQATQYGNYNYHHNYIKFDGYGNLESFDRMTTDQLCDFPQTLADYIIENENDFEHLFDLSQFN